MSHILTPRISATELARNLASVIDQVRVSRARMVITRGTQDVAEIIPIKSNGMTLADLGTLLQRSALTQAECQSFSDDLRDIRSAATLPPSAWD